MLSAMHLPTPLHLCTAAAKGLLRPINATARRSASVGRGSTSTPGFSRLSGSKAALTEANRSRADAEYIVPSRADRARPSPCSPDIDPP